jgi:uncharacterized protein (DUF1800 family)
MPDATGTSSQPAPAPAERARPDAAPARAWERYEPSAACPWNLARAGHLYRRAGFGATWDELQQALKLGPQRTVDGLLAGGPEAAAFNQACDNDDKAVSSAQALPAWWLRRMIATPHPLLEKLTLFWHNFFAVSAARIDSAPLLRGHLQRLRAGAMGDSRTLTAQVLADPAIFLSLGAEASRKARPEEHLARQLLHRYTVGADRCAEKDVREASRAMTGWFVLRLDLRYIQREHDDGEKTVLGTAAPLDAAGVVALAAGHRDTARGMVRKLYRWFLSEADEPDEALLAPLSESFARDFDVGRLVGTMLRSNLFFSPGTLRRHVKRPVEFALGLVRALEASVSTTRLAADLAALGEDLLCPPTPAGWAGGRHWINPATLIARGNLAASLLAASGPYEGRLDPAAVARRHGHAEDQAAGRFVADLLLQPDPADETTARLWGAPPPAGALPGRLREFACRLATQPEFQLA